MELDARGYLRKTNVKIASLYYSVSKRFAYFEKRKCIVQANRKNPISDVSLVYLLLFYTYIQWIPTLPANTTLFISQIWVGESCAHSNVWRHYIQSINGIKIIGQFLLLSQRMVE